MSSSLYEESSITIPEVTDIDSIFLNRLTVLYGESGTGKTSLILHVLKNLKQHIPVAVVANPTNKLNNNYSGIFPEQAIHDEISKDVLIKLFKRQIKSMHLYNLINDMSILDPIFTKCASPRDKEKIQILIQTLTNHKNKIRQKYTEFESEKHISNIQSLHNKKVTDIMRMVINDNSAKLLADPCFTDKQNLVIRNILFNPNILLLLDDCASTVKEWKDLTETRKLFFEGRHYHTTVLITMHNETLIPPPLRNNAHINIFTAETAVTTYFRKDACGISAAQKKNISKIAKSVFEDSGDKKKPNFKKLCYFSPVINVDTRIQYILARPTKFKFGSEPFRALCNQLKKNEVDDSEALVNYFK